MNSTNSLTVEWEDNANVSVNYAVVIWSEITNTSETMMTVGSSNQFATVTFSNLIPGDLYNASVTAVNEMGSSGSGYSNNLQRTSMSCCIVLVFTVFFF